MAVVVALGVYGYREYRFRSTLNGIDFDLARRSIRWIEPVEPGSKTVTSPRGIKFPLPGVIERVEREGQEIFVCDTYRVWVHTVGASTEVRSDDEILHQIPIPKTFGKPYEIPESPEDRKGIHDSFFQLSLRTWSWEAPSIESLRKMTTQHRRAALGIALAKSRLESMYSEAPIGIISSDLVALVRINHDNFIEIQVACESRDQYALLILLPLEDTLLEPHHQAFAIQIASGLRFEATEFPP